MSEFDAEYGANQDGYEPGVPVRERLRDRWDRLTGGWAPDLRTAGFLLLGVYGAGLVANLLTIDTRIENASLLLRGVARIGPGLLAVDLSNALARLAVVPGELAICAGAVALALRLNWGRLVALVGLAVLFLVDLVPPLVFLLSAPRGVSVRLQLVNLVFALAPAALVAVLLWCGRDDAR